MSIHHRIIAALAAAALLFSACSSDSDGAADTPPDPTEVTEPAPTGESEEPDEGVEDEPEEEPVLRILVSNDDGYEADGIDTLVSGLLTLDNVEIIVYAPEEQQSGTGGRVTDGPVDVRDAELGNGHPVRAVDGYPSDSVRVAIDEEGIEVDLVVTGINEGQNLGPIMDVSGTVGAARAAVERGIPALATSQGFHDPTYEDAIPFILEWIEDNREALLDGSAELKVMNLNVPTCPTGELRGLVEAPPADEEQSDDGGGPLSVQDCESTLDEAEVDNDVLGFNNGFAVLSQAPSEPAA